MQVVYDDYIVLPIPSKTGYKFLGWYNDSVLVENGVWNIDADIELKAEWQVEEYAISYNLCGGKNSQDNPSSYTFFSEEIVFFEPTRNGCVFEGWYKDESFKEKITAIPSGSLGDVELWAKWQAEKFTISYIMNEGINDEENPFEYTADDNFTLKEPIKLGYDFLGWTGSGLEEITKEVVIPFNSYGDRIYTANWQVKEEMLIFDFEYRYGGCYIYGMKDTSVKTVFIPECVTVISESAFTDCKNLESVIFEENSQCTSINKKAFYGCRKLKEITLPNNLKKIGDAAFSDCSGLKEIIIPDSIQNIGSSAFYGCSFENMYYLGDLSNWCSIEFSGSSANPMSVSENKYISGNLLQGECIVSGEITEIGNYAFINCDEITSITISDSITSIGNGAFSNCINLRDINLSANLKSIGYYAFEQCENLSDVKIPDSVTALGEGAFRRCKSLTSIAIPKGIQSIENWIFSECDKLESVVLHSDIKSIGENAFADCQSLINIALPDGLTTIGVKAFSNCTSLKSISIPASVSEIGNLAFYNCGSVESIEVKQGNLIYADYGNCLIEKASKTLINGCNNSVIPDDGSVTSIKESAFSNCKGLKNIVIPQSVTNIGVSAFRNCTGLESVVLSENLTTIEADLFLNCTGLKEIVIPDSVTSIGESAFENCIALTNAIIGNGVTNIEKNAFYECKNLSSVIMGNSITNIDDLAFAYCSMLSRVELSDNLTSLGGLVFYNCVGLENIVIKDKLNYIDYGTFDKCNSLTDVYYEGNIYDWCNINFDDWDSNPTSVASNLYINGELLENLVIPEGITKIGNYAFVMYQRLKSVTIPESLNNIAMDAFYECEGIEDVYYNGDLIGWCNMSYENVDANPMYYAKNLYINGQLLQGDLIIPDGITNIPKAAFANCSGLRNIIISESVTSIESYAFSECNSVVKITIPATVQKMQRYSFYDCRKMIVCVEADSKPVGWENNWYTAVDVIWNCKNSDLGDDGYRYITYEGLNYAIKDNEARIVGNDVSGNVIIPSQIEYEGKIYAIKGIDAWAFSNCTDITGIIFDKGEVGIYTGAFENCNNLKYIYYNGTARDRYWSIIFSEGNSALLKAKACYYSESQPTEEGAYWHYVDGVPTIW